MIDDAVQVREATARAAIKQAFGAADDEWSVGLFASHHLDELEGAYWQKHLGTTEPEPRRILDLLILRSHWGDDENDDLEIFDFTLPDDVANYVIGVRFDPTGKVEEISMES
jgi:hypothetical protein